MPIEFESPKPIVQTQFVLKTVAEEMMRSKSRYFDEHEHEIPWDYIEFMHTAMKAMGVGSLAPKEKPSPSPSLEGRGNGGEGGNGKRPPIAYQVLAAQIEALAWGDVGMYLVTPGGGLGAAAVQAAGTPEQRAKFLARFGGEKPTLAAMCMTEAGAGSDTSAIRTRAVLDEKTNEWVLNGEKIFVTAGDKSLTEYEKLGKGFVVVWASIDPSAGRAGMRAFVVEAGTPGVKVTKLEHKLGIRVSDTASISLVDARVPFDHILGSPTVEKTTTGFKGAMATFDATRPLVAASGLGVARAALEFLNQAAAHELPVLILLDLNMPVMNGIEFLQVVKHHARWRRIPVVVLTTSEEEQDKIASFDLSVAGYMTKPVDYRKFVDAMRTIDAYWTLSEVAPIA